MKFLLIESDQVLLELTSKHLKKEGHVCEHANGYKESFKKVNNHEYDGIIVETNLPDGDGLKLVDMLRKESPDTVIIIVSNRETVTDRITGLDHGADDYLAKPCNLAELSARIKAIFRRKNRSNEQLLDFGDLKINLDERSAYANGTPLPLTKKEYDILLFLARSKNRVVTKDSIAEHLWGDYMDDVVSYDFIYAHVKNLRKKLDAHGCGEVLKTVYGIGYKFSSH